MLESLLVSWLLGFWSTVVTLVITDMMPDRGGQEGSGEQCRTHYCCQGGYCKGQNSGAGDFIDEMPMK